MKDKYTGKCYRHVLKFIPGEQFDNNCPACFWESKHQNLLASQESGLTKDAPDLAKTGSKDGPVYIQRVHGNSFRTIDPPSG